MRNHLRREATIRGTRRINAPARKRDDRLACRHVSSCHVAASCADYACKAACPVAIDTGTLIKDLREHEHGPRAQNAALQVARHYGLAERAARLGLVHSKREIRLP